MAVTITKQPTSPNMANNDVLFVATSTKSSQPLYQMVVDIYQSGSATRLQRIKQQPNDAGICLFNVGQILNSYLEADNIWKAAPFATSSNCNIDFIVKFGEEYGTSISASFTTLYNGVTDSAGEPSKTGSAYYTFTDGLVDYPNAVDWNFDRNSYFTEESASVYNTFSYQHALTNAPTTQSINDGDYATISLYNGNFADSDGDVSVSAQDVAYVIVNVFNAAGANVQNYQYENIVSEGGGPRTTANTLWNNIYTSQSDSTRLIHIAAGPANFADEGTPLTGSWAYYNVKVVAQGDDGLENNDGVWANIRYTKETGECSYNGVRFAWKNEFGVWDYYTFTLQSDSRFSIQRNSFEQSFVDYSTASTTPSYDKTRRGSKQFYNALDNVKTANSNWLTQAEADWLRELFFSADVYIQSGTTFEPVVITSADMVEKTNPRTQKNFQYQIEFKPANQLRPRE